MSEISTYKLIKEKLQAIPPTKKGSLFEKISRHFLIEHDSANEYESIDLWNDWELRGKEGDRGIDIVVTTTSKEYIAVQCKYHQNNISLNDIATFLTQLQSGVQSVVGKIRFKKGIIISTSNLSSNALKAIEQIRSNGMGIDIDEITEEDFIYSKIDWEKLDPTQSELPLCDKKKPRPHQTEAINATKEYFSDPKNTRGKLIMACGTGKTYTSLKIMEALDPKITLFLAPSIALLSQTFREYAQEKSEPFYASIVCSDDKVGKGKKNKNDDNSDDINFSELPLKPSTRLEDILSVHKKAQKENKRFIIFSTYQSALRIQEAQRMGLGGIDLIICDEAHRTVGAMYSSNERDDKNAFTLCHSDANIKAKKRLYMTATPKVYSESSKAKAKESDNVIYSMDDEEIFGEEIYTLNFERAIALDLLSDYKVIILAVRKENLSGVTNSVNHEVVDFILIATNGILKKHFNTDFNDKNITIFDPFTGTGSFIARLLSKENELISDEALKEKFQKNLFAFDIVLLSYYIALINITQAAQNRDRSLKNFKNIALTDSLDYLEEKTNKGVFKFFEDLEKNKEIKDTLADQNIRVIIGNPPYSAGAKSQNDNNQNLSHEKLEKLVYEKYGKNSSSKAAGNTTRDTLIQSIRMASDLLKDKGVVGFVVNGSFIDSKSADGFRKCVAKEFSHLYVLNLRGNQHTSGEVSKKEGGKIFDSGSRATIAIIFFVKDTSVSNNTIHYYDIGDYLKREAKLNKLAEFEDLDSVGFETITPNDKGDWINQREDAFDKLIPLKRDKKLQNPSVFDINSMGVVSGRDPWVYNFSPNALTQSVQKCIDTYNADLKRFNERYREAFKQRTAKDKGIKPADRYKHLNDKEITTDKTKIAWTDGLKNKLIKNKNLQESRKERMRISLYRPFNKQWLYWDKDLINRQGEFSKIFPDKDAQNVVINTGVGYKQKLKSYNNL
nr:DEAD/DEAH box helicase family protein [Helicobacter pylori]